MYCTTCGAYIKDEYCFCTQCGTHRPIKPRTQRGSRRIPVIITALMFFFGLFVYVFFQFF